MDGSGSLASTPASPTGSRVGSQTTDADDRLAALLTPELDRLRRFARVLVDDADAADDLVGEAIARTIPQWRSGKVHDCGAYVRRVMVNLAARRWRRRAVGRRRDHAALDWLGAAPDSPHEIAERDRTLKAIVELPVRRRAVVVLRFYEDMPLRQIAATLGVSEGTVKSQLSRALEQLRVAFEGQEES